MVTPFCSDTRQTPRQPFRTGTERPAKGSVLVTSGKVAGKKGQWRIDADATVRLADAQSVHRSMDSKCAGEMSVIPGFFLDPVPAC